MILDILKYPDPRLKQSSVKINVIDEGTRRFIDDLEQTMRAGPGGVGIAAPQVGRFEQIVIVDISSRPKFSNHGRMILINPELTHWEGLKTGREGCLSVPDYTGNVVRAERITVQALDEYGKPVEYHCEDFEARAIQHELDHLNGLLFLDRLVSRRNDLYKRK